MYEFRKKFRKMIRILLHAIIYLHVTHFLGDLEKDRCLDLILNLLGVCICIDKQGIT